MKSSNPAARRWIWIVAAIVLLAATATETANAQLQEPAPAASPDDAQDNPGDPSPNLKEKRGAVAAAIYMLAGIVLLGCLVVLMIWVWGMRVRRLARSSPGQRTSVDQLWYLRPKKHPQDPPATNTGDAENT